MKHSRNSELSRRRQLFREWASACPTCGEVWQVQLVDWLVSPGRWRCRVCKTAWAFEPEERPSPSREKPVLQSIRTLKPIDHLTSTGVVKIPRHSSGVITATFHSNGIGDVHSVDVVVGGTVYALTLHPNDVERTE